ncbi:MAG: hypothetical protein JRN68_05740 [Nitrososphaerota archaeon]|nr:hypothetical protein [Nitrososphaerota archaeon]
MRHAGELEKEGEYLLPATHLMMEESPDAAALRIARRWVGYPEAKPSFVMVQSHLRPSSLWKGQTIYRQGSNHWDICFVYTMCEERLPSEIKPWWKEMKFVSPSEFTRLALGRGHRDILEEGGFLNRKRLMPK